jgi:hypothetical protein
LRAGSGGWAARAKGRLTKVFYSDWLPLGLVVCLAIAIRSIPVWLHAAWGSDLGIYYSLTSSLVDGGTLSPSYSGWGESYEGFPTLYVISAIPHLLTGLDQLWLLTKVAPILGGLSVAFLFLIARNLGVDRRIALLAALLLALNSVHVYQTSHAAPMTVGHFFLLACLHIQTKERRGVADWAMLALFTLLLVCSHHFTTYIYLISLPLAATFGGAGRARCDLGVIVFSSTVAFAYWSLVATDVTLFARTATGLPWIAVVSAYAIFVAVVFAARPLARRFMGWLKSPVSYRADTIKFVLGLSVMTATVAFLALSGYSIVSIGSAPLIILYSVPLIASTALALPGAWLLATKPGGGRAVGWLLAILLSLGASLALSSTILLPERHLEYAFEPLSICAALGLVRLAAPIARRDEVVAVSEPSLVAVRSREPGPLVSLMPERRIGLQTWAASSRVAWTIRIPRKGGRMYVRAACALAIAVLLVGSVVASYGAMREFGIDESISDEDLRAVDWLAGNCSGVVASDHRLCTLLEANGLRGTFEDGAGLWNASSWVDCWSVLNGSGHGCVSHVLVDRTMCESGVALPGLNMPPLPECTREMLSRQPFEPRASFRNDTTGEWAEAYAVNWSHIGQAFDQMLGASDGNLNVGLPQSTHPAVTQRDAGGLTDAAVTQLGECKTEDLEVAGSNPACGTHYFHSRAGLRGLTVSH